MGSGFVCTEGHLEKHSGSCVAGRKLCSEIDDAVKEGMAHRRSQSDLSCTYSSMVFRSQMRHYLPRYSVSTGPVTTEVVSAPCTCPSTCTTAQPTVAVDATTEPKTTIGRSISAGLHMCRVRSTARVYLSSITLVKPTSAQPYSQHLDDSMPYSIQLHSIKSRYNYAPKPSLKVPYSTSVSGFTSAQSPLHLTPSASLSTPSCGGGSTPSSCHSGDHGDCGIALASGRRIPAVPVVGVPDTKNNLRQMKLPTGPRVTGLPPASSANLP